jgi:hypothetical protein
VPKREGGLFEPHLDNRAHKCFFIFIAWIAKNLDNKIVGDFYPLVTVYQLFYVGYVWNCDFVDNKCDFKLNCKNLIVWKLRF